MGITLEWTFWFYIYTCVVQHFVFEHLIFVISVHYHLLNKIGLDSNRNFLSNIPKIFRMVLGANSPQIAVETSLSSATKYLR